MWQRFTERARRVVFFAQEEAGRLGENYVSTEHLLLGLTREDDSVAARILDRQGIPLERIRKDIERQLARGDGNSKKDMQLTPRAKRVIDLAYDEARHFGNNYIGSEHLLLGLIREGEGLAGRVLSHLGVDLDRTRAEVIRLQNAEPDKDTPTEATPQRRGALQELLGRIAGQKMGNTEKLSSMPNGAQPGDLGVVKAPEGRGQVEVALDAAAFVRLADIFLARDAYGYRAMAHGDQTMFLIPNGAPLKYLLPPAGSEAATEAEGLYVRVLSGEYEGYAGWIFAAAFDRTGPDEAPFPPELDH